jgi:hypothetical protein
MDNDTNNQNESGGSQSWLERLKGRALGDIRIHDSAQAGELARRLGARAFTVGRDIYVRSELVDAKTPEGEALLAHEITHAVEQSGGSASDMPLLRPHLHRSSTSGGSGASGGGLSVQRASVGGTGGSAPASLPSSEVAAEAVESSSLQSAQAPSPQAQGGGGGGQRQGDQQNTQSAQSPNAEEVAERVYELMMREIIIDTERSAHL